MLPSQVDERRGPRLDARRTAGDGLEAILRRFGMTRNSEVEPGAVPVVRHDNQAAVGFASSAAKG